MKWRFFANYVARFRGVSYGCTRGGRELGTLAFRADFLMSQLGRQIVRGRGFGT
jgi:hypothetical protein